MPILARILIVAIALSGCAAPGCDPLHFEWQGPSEAFDAVDPNHDGARTREEWEMLNETFLYPESGAREFIAADCDSDGVYTWHEYFEQRFNSQLCVGLRDDLGIAQVRWQRPTVSLQRAWPVLRTSDMGRQLEHLLGGADSAFGKFTWPTHHREVPFAPGRAVLVKVVAVRIERRKGMPRGVLTQGGAMSVSRWPGEYDVAHIELANEGKVPIAVVMLRIRATTGMGEYETVHIKAVNIAPAGRQMLDAWYGAIESRMAGDQWIPEPFGATALDVAVLGAREGREAM
jgi:hypothetical protein